MKTAKTTVKVKGYKGFNKDFTCLNYHFKVGKTFKHEGQIQLCKEGFHFCKDLKDVFSFYGFNDDTIICEVEASGEVIDANDNSNKSVCSVLKVVKKLTKDEILKLSNSGSDNLGHSNAGHSNAGSYNAGNDNAGHSNAGSYNAGHSNAGHSNAGNDNAGHSNAGSYNAGHSNAGSYNAGHSNAGHRNAGSYNAGNDNAGLFNSKPGKLRLFNKETNVKFEDQRIQIAIQNSPSFQEYIDFSNMNEEEKKVHPYAQTTGGYYRKTGYKEGWLRFWGNATDSVKKIFLNLPNFDADVFEEITGIKIDKKGWF